MKRQTRQGFRTLLAPLVLAGCATVKTATLPAEWLSAGHLDKPTVAPMAPAGPSLRIALVAPRPGDEKGASSYDQSMLERILQSLQRDCNCQLELYREFDKRMLDAGFDLIIRDFRFARRERRAQWTVLLPIITVGLVPAVWDEVYQEVAYVRVMSDGSEQPRLMRVRYRHWLGWATFAYYSILGHGTKVKEFCFGFIPIQIETGADASTRRVTLRGHNEMTLTRAVLIAEAAAAHHSRPTENK